MNAPACLWWLAVAAGHVGRAGGDSVWALPVARIARPQRNGRSVARPRHRDGPGGCGQGAAFAPGRGRGLSRAVPARSVCRRRAERTPCHPDPQLRRYRGAALRGHAAGRRPRPRLFRSSQGRVDQVREDAEHIYEAVLASDSSAKVTDTFRNSSATPGPSATSSSR